jgi:uncharacterized membrane protein YebE (DUF533 family)
MDIEKLLGKLLNEVKDSGGEQFKQTYRKISGSEKKKHKKGKKYKKEQKKALKKAKKKDKKKNVQQLEPTRGKKSSDSSLLGNLTGNLATGKGLLTAIGLGVGAYEIYRSSRKNQPPVPGQGHPAAAQTMPPSPPPPPPVSPGGEFRSPESVVSEVQSADPGHVPASGQGEMSVKTSLGEQEIARRLIQVMVGAAHADGILDADEEKAILDRLRAMELEQDEMMFLLAELHNPRSVSELTAGIDDPGLAQTMYAVAVSTVVVDTDNERKWLDELAESLNISPDLQQFIEEFH